MNAKRAANREAQVNWLQESAIFGISSVWTRISLLLASLSAVGLAPDKKLESGRTKHNCWSSTFLKQRDEFANWENERKAHVETKWTVGRAQSREKNPQVSGVGWVGVREGPAGCLSLSLYSSCHSVVNNGNTQIVGIVFQGSWKYNIPLARIKRWWSSWRWKWVPPSIAVAEEEDEDEDEAAAARRSVLLMTFLYSWVIF